MVHLHDNLRMQQSSNACFAEASRPTLHDFECYLASLLRGVKMRSMAATYRAYGVWLLGQPQAQLPSRALLNQNMSASSLPSAKLLPPKIVSWLSTMAALWKRLSGGAVPEAVTAFQRQSLLPRLQTLRLALLPPNSTKESLTSDKLAPCKSSRHAM